MFPFTRAPFWVPIFDSHSNDSQAVQVHGSRALRLAREDHGEGCDSCSCNLAEAAPPQKKQTTVNTDLFAMGLKNKLSTRMCFFAMGFKGAKPRRQHVQCEGLGRSQVDVWALGCLMVEIISSRLPHEECTSIQQVMTRPGENPSTGVVAGVFVAWVARQGYWKLCRCTSSNFGVLKEKQRETTVWGVVPGVARQGYWMHQFYQCWMYSLGGGPPY